MTLASLSAGPVRGERTAEIVARRLSQAILDGEIAPGSRLREETLAARYGVSRTPIREALMLLSSSGLIELAPNRGATVLALTAADITEIYRLRGLLEAEAVRLAGGHVTPGLLRLLEASCDRLARLHGAAAADQLAADVQFHYGIAEAAGSPRLYALIRQVCAIPEGYRSSIAYGHADLSEAERQHRGIAAALGQGHGTEAAELMRGHVDWAGRLAVRSLAGRLSSAQPSSAQPSSARPSSARPSSARLSSAQPSSAQPSSARPSSARPSSARPSSARPSSARPSPSPGAPRP